MKKKQAPNGKPHLGGHGFKTHIDRGLLEFFIKTFSIKSMLDIGCGPGGMVDLAIENNIDAYGIDGDDRLDRKNPHKILIHDFTVGPYDHNRNYSLGYSCEFVEHVYEEYIKNYINSFKQCDHVIMTFAPLGTKGHHHVNCNTKEYWIDIFESNGFSYDPQVTNDIKKISTMEREFIRENGLYFLNIK